MALEYAFGTGVALEYRFGAGMRWEGWKQPLGPLGVGLCGVTCAVPAQGDATGEFSQWCFPLLFLFPRSWAML